MRIQTIALACVIIMAVALSAAGCAPSDRGSAAGGAQTIKVSANGQFVPSGVAKAGVPIRLEFGQGSGCTLAIQFADLGIFEDLTDGGGTVDLPALAPGSYPLVCQADMVMGTLEVQ